MSTLWSMWDLSSALLSLRFHTSWRAGESPLTALSGVQKWLCGHTGRGVRDAALPWLLSMMRTGDQRSLCIVAAEGYIHRHPDTHPFTSPVHWAPFTAVGLIYRLPQWHGASVRA